jgi:hypothetical protein
MARILYVSDNLEYMRVDYPSEPMLAFAARWVIYGKPTEVGMQDRLLKYYQRLEYYI